MEEARKWVGPPYRLGGSSSSEIDCSGLTMRVHEKFGEKLPHRDDKQYRYGEEVSSEHQAGDLVFFDEHRDGISHVGIATGTGTLVHASNHFDKVIESDMKDIEVYKGARRLCWLENRRPREPPSHYCREGSLLHTYKNVEKRRSEGCW